MFLLLVACSDDFTADPKPDRGAMGNDSDTAALDGAAPDTTTPDSNIADALAEAERGDASDAQIKDASMCWANGDLCNVYQGDGGAYTKCCSGTTPDKCVKDQNNAWRCVP
jgi:hypothetical protein